MSRKQKIILYRIIAAALLLAAVSFIPATGILRLFLFTLPYLVTGYDVLYSAIRNIINGQVFDENFLMAIATVGAFCTGEYPEAVFVMLFYQVGELFQSMAVRKSRKSIAALMDIRPTTAVVLRNGEEVTLSPEEVEIGEILVVRPGEKIPLDGKICEGSTAVDTSSLTGESMPLDKSAGASVISGTVNLSGVIKVETTSVYTDSTVAKILALVETTAEKKAKTESFITRFAKYYTPIVVICALLLAVIPPLILNGNWSEWINRALIFLVVSCPCALVVSVPLTFFGGIGGCSRKGILIKGAVSLEALSGADTFVFDKTGTLTCGSFYIERICPQEISADSLLSLAAAAESHSNHPVARCIAEAGSNGSAHTVAQVKEIAGMGISAEIDGESYFLGNAALMEKHGVKYCNEALNGTVVHISDKNRYLGYICVADRVKEEAVQAITALKECGISDTVMLTGDSQGTAKAVAEKLKIDRYFAELLPDQKVEKVEKLLESGKRIAFVGDGINDAPVLTRTDIGIAMGALGSDAAIEAADIVIMDDKLTRLPEAVSLCRRTMRIVKQNIVFALAVKAIILILGAVGLANMWLAVFGDVGVTVIAILNAMRTLHIKE